MMTEEQGQFHVALGELVSASQCTTVEFLQTLAKCAATLIRASGDDHFKALALAALTTNDLLSELLHQLNSDAPEEIRE